MYPKGPHNSIKLSHKGFSQHLHAILQSIQLIPILENPITYKSLMSKWPRLVEIQSWLWRFLFFPFFLFETLYMRSCIYYECVQSTCSWSLWYCVAFGCRHCKNLFHWFISWYYNIGRVLNPHSKIPKPSSETLVTRTQNSHSELFML